MDALKTFLSYKAVCIKKQPPPQIKIKQTNRQTGKPQNYNCLEGVLIPLTWLVSFCQPLQILTNDVKLLGR